MTRLPAIEQELHRAITRRTARRRRWRPAVLATAAAVLTSSAALAASALVHLGSPAPKGKTPAEGHEGVGIQGSARLAAVRTADPAGGPPWGLRVFHTATGRSCVQTGRVADGMLGVWTGDGVLHPLPLRAASCTTGATIVGLSGVVPMVASGEEQAYTCLTADSKQRLRDHRRELVRRAASGAESRAELRRGLAEIQRNLARRTCAPTDVRTVIFGFTRQPRRAITAGGVRTTTAADGSYLVIKTNTEP